MSDRIKARSTEQHRRFFGLVAATFHNWPEKHKFQPENPEHLRAWLLVRAKHCIIKSFFLEGDADQSAKLIPFVFAAMTGQHSWARAVGNELQVCVADSIAFDKCPHETFCRISNSVEEIIEAETGLRADDLLKAREAAEAP